MVKQQFIDHLTHNCGLHHDSAIRAVNGFVSLLKGALTSGESVSIRGLGSFKIINMAERTARNPATGEPVVIPPRKVIRFYPAAEVKHLLNDPAYDA